MLPLWASAETHAIFSSDDLRFLIHIFVFGGPCMAPVGLRVEKHQKNKSCLNFYAKIWSSLEDDLINVIWSVKINITSEFQ